MNKTRFIALALMILTAAASRLIPHPPNFTPVAAIALFGGAKFADRRVALLVPLAALFLSDIVLGFHALMPVIYATFGLIVALGFRLRHNGNGLRIATATVVSAVLFFLLTNFGVWALGTLYPRTLNGLMECYVAAIPFFRNMLLGNVLYSALLFGGVTLAERHFAAMREDTIAASTT
jgi:hypothetical protein